MQARRRRSDHRPFLDGKRIPASQLGSVLETPVQRARAAAGWGHAEMKWVSRVLIGLSCTQEGWMAVPWRALRNVYVGASLLDRLLYTQKTVPEIPEDGVRTYRMGRLAPRWMTLLPLIGSRRFEHPEFELLDGIRMLLARNYVQIVQRDGVDYLIPTDALVGIPVSQHSGSAA